MPLLIRVLRVLMLILVSTATCAIHVVLVWSLVVPILSVVIHAFLPVLRVAAIIAILVTS